MTSFVFATGGQEFYDHAIGYSIIVPAKYATSVLAIDDENLIAQFKDEAGNDTKFIIHATNIYEELDPETVEGLDEAKISLGNDIFNDTYKSHSFMVAMLGKIADSYAGGGRDTKYLQYVNINGIIFWCYNFRFLDANKNETGEGKIFFTIHKGKSYQVSIISKNALLSSIPEVEQTLASLQLGRKVSPAMKYIWIIVGFLNLTFFLLMMWIITRPRKYSRRQMIRREQRALRKAARKGLPPPTPEISAETQLVPIQRELPKIYRVKEPELLELVSQSVRHKKALEELDAILGRDEYAFEVYDHGLDTDSAAKSREALPEPQESGDSSAGLPPATEGASQADSFADGSQSVEAEALPIAASGGLPPAAIPEAEEGDTVAIQEALSEISVAPAGSLPLHGAGNEAESQPAASKATDQATAAFQEGRAGGEGHSPAGAEAALTQIEEQASSAAPGEQRVRAENGAHSGDEASARIGEGVSVAEELRDQGDVKARAASSGTEPSLANESHRKTKANAKTGSAKHQSEAADPITEEVSKKADAPDAEGEQKPPAASIVSHSAARHPIPEESRQSLSESASDSLSEKSKNPEAETKAPNGKQGIALEDKQKVSKKPAKKVQDISKLSAPPENTPAKKRRRPEFDSPEVDSILFSLDRNPSERVRNLSSEERLYRSLTTRLDKILERASEETEAHPSHKLVHSVTPDAKDSKE
ncbi:MAG: hypothetical protein LBC69_04210 [Eubacteriaceae bacterium]|nr:hypothetical protein [Eubacteriaceae bacterium]